jgi:hypothetical protein
MITLCSEKNDNWIETVRTKLGDKHAVIAGKGCDHNRMHIIVHMQFKPTDAITLIQSRQV